jgi:outer membrane protein TolC
MIPLTELHEPTPEFRAHLEWQIQTALRRESRLASPVSSPGRRLVAALVVVAALVSGGLVGIASGHLQDARQRDQLIEAARSEEMVVRVRVDLVRTVYEDTRRRFDVGTVDRETLLSVEKEMREMESSLARIHLDIEEIQLTSAAPRNDLDAPLVGQRDFVRQRLMLEMANAQNALSTAEQGLAEAERRVQTGMASPAAAFQKEAGLAQARSQMQLLQAKLQLRQRFLAGDLTRDALAPMLRRTELTLQLERGQREVDFARRRVEEVRRLVQVGQGTELDLKRAEVELLERELEIKGVQRELKILGTVKR